MNRFLVFGIVCSCAATLCGQEPFFSGQVCYRDGTGVPFSNTSSTYVLVVRGGEVLAEMKTGKDGEFAMRALGGNERVVASVIIYRNDRQSVIVPVVIDNVVFERQRASILRVAAWRLNEFSNYDETTMPNVQKVFEKSIQLISDKSPHHVNLKNIWKAISDSRLRLLLPAYVHPSDGAWSKVDDAIAALGPHGGVIAILNPQNGPGTFDQKVHWEPHRRRLSDRGVTCIGYVDSRNFETAIKDVREWGRLYPALSGIFLDGLNCKEESIAASRELRSIVREAFPKRITTLIVANPGATDASAKFVDEGIVDILCVYSGKFDDKIELPRWSRERSGSDVAALMYGVNSPERLEQTLRLLENARIRVIGMTDSGGPDDGMNPWNQFPMNWPLVMTELRKRNDRLPGNLLKQ